MTQTTDLPEYIRKARAEEAATYPPHVIEAGGIDHYQAGQSQGLHDAILRADWSAVRAIAADPYTDGEDVDLAVGALAGACEPLTVPTKATYTNVDIWGPEIPAPAVIDATHLARQRDFSHRTFGPGPRTEGVLDHIRKELREIEAAPDDLSEWVDVVILALDGAWRAGHEPQQIIDAIKAKQAKNEARVWPDWRTAKPGQAIEHDRTAD